MEMSEYDETRTTARLPNLDIEIFHRRPWEGNEEHLMVTLRAVPSNEALGRLLEVSNPLLVWTRMMETAWSPWVRGLGLSQSLKMAIEWARRGCLPHQPYEGSPG